MVTAATFRRSALSLATGLLLATCGVNIASAGTVLYSSYTWVGDIISIKAPNAVTGGAGQITLQLTGGGTLLAWCVDIFHELQSSHDQQNSGTYNVGTPGNSTSMTTAVIGKIGALILEGNALIKNGLNWSGTAINVHDISAAVQVAIWSTEYGSSTFKYNTIAPTGSLPGANTFVDLVTYMEMHAGADYFGWNTLYVTDGSNQQELAFVPGPIVGAGLPGMVLAGLGGLVLWRRRQSSNGSAAFATA